MVLALLVFLLGAGGVFGAYWAVTSLPEMMKRRELEQRLRDVASPADGGASEASILKQTHAGPLPSIDRVIATMSVGSSLSKLIEQSGVRTSPSTIIVSCVVGAALGAFLCATFVRLPFAPLGGALVGLFAPIGMLRYKRTRRLRNFEEMFPEALDLLSRAIRAGHAFQTAMGMVADELGEPVGPEFKKCFDQQNFGLPIRDALNQLAERMPLLDVRFFVTAVLIQRDTGGNLAEILDNLAHVVRERFKILRQVRVHTAHGRFTGWVLMALPAALGVALQIINPAHMELLFKTRIGQQLLMVAIVMQVIGYIWIRKVIKIEV
jgi:tight adherence protein B